MRLLAGILLLVLGVAYPMAALYWMNRRMNRRPALSPRQVGLLLALNGILPVSMVFWGIGMLVPRLWAVLAVRLIAGSTALASLFIVAALRSMSTQSRPPAAPKGGKTDG